MSGNVVPMLQSPKEEPVGGPVMKKWRISRAIRGGITIVESLVVVAILFVLCAIIIPAIQLVRDAANKTICKSNLRTLVMASHLYHGEYGTFPSGCTVSLDDGRMPFASWILRLTPYMELEYMFVDAVNEFKRQPLFFRDGHRYRYENMKTVLCPSEERVKSIKNKNVAFTHYLGVSGEDYLTNNGMLYIDSSIKMAQVTDGVSNTLFLGERPPSSEEEMGWWYAGWGQNKTGSLDVVLGVRELNSGRCAECPGNGSGPFHFQPGGRKSDLFHFWSHHPGGGHFAFVDGSVHFLRYSSDPLLPALASRQGGEGVTPPQE